MDHRSLVALIAAALLLQLHAHLLRGAPLGHEAQRTADLRRMGVDLAAVAVGPSGPGRNTLVLSSL